MNRWQEQFAQEMNALYAQSTSRFDQFAQDVLDPVVESLAGFLEQWHYELTMPACEKGRMMFRFALTEDAYLLAWFRLEGFDSLQFEYEYSLPGQGHVAGVRTTGGLRAADADWAQSCLQMALSTFVTKFLELGKCARVAEPILA